MAPILAASIGVTPQLVDDERLRSLKDSLLELEFKGPVDPSLSSPEEVSMPLDIERLVTLLAPWQSWPSEEQVSSMLQSHQLRQCKFRLRYIRPSTRLTVDLAASPWRLASVG